MKVYADTAQKKTAQPLFVCNRGRHFRYNAINITVNAILKEEIMIQQMLQDENKLEHITNMIKEIMKAKKDDE